MRDSLIIFLPHLLLLGRSCEFGGSYTGLLMENLFCYCAGHGIVSETVIT